MDGFETTINVSVAGKVLVTPSKLTNDPAGIVLVKLPGTVPLTGMTMVHEEEAPSVPLVKWINRVPGTAVSERGGSAPQVDVAAGAGAEAMIRPTGNVSETSTPVNPKELVF